MKLRNLAEHFVNKLSIALIYLESRNYVFN
jgi:hypothetical protein